MNQKQDSNSNSPEAGMTPEYWCFISYRHADNREEDRQWAAWLHRAIEQYDVPAELIGTKNSRGDEIPERIYPVFRDEDSLPADAHLGERIREALDRSRFLVVLCSPRAVESQYVTQEILHFKQSGKSDRIVAAILAGEPGDSDRECFPETLRHPVREDGSLDTTLAEEPIAADFRLKVGGEGFTSAEAYRSKLTNSGNFNKREVKRRAEAYDAQLQLMKLKIIAGILGVPLETLRDRDRAYQLELARIRARKLRRWLGAVTLLAFLAIAAAWVANDQRKTAVKERQLAEDARDDAQGMINFMLFDLQDKLRPFGRLDLLQDVAQRADDYFATKEMQMRSRTGFSNGKRRIDSTVTTITRGRLPPGLPKRTNITCHHRLLWAYHNRWGSLFTGQSWFFRICRNRRGMLDLSDTSIFGIPFSVCQCSSSNTQAPGNP